MHCNGLAPGELAGMRQIAKPVTDKFLASSQWRAPDDLVS